MGLQRRGVEQRKILLVLSCQLPLFISPLTHLLLLTIGSKNSSSEGSGFFSKYLSEGLTVIPFPFQPVVSF